MAQLLFDEIDCHILEVIQAEGRLTNLDLADRVGLSPSPCLRRLRRLEEQGIIEGYSARLNREKLGLGVTTFVSVNIARHHDTDAEDFMAAVRRIPEVVSCYVTSGESDFLLQVVVPDLEAYRKFAMEKLIRVTGVKDIRSSFVIQTVKDGAPLPVPPVR